MEHRVMYFNRILYASGKFFIERPLQQILRRDINGLLLESREPALCVKFGTFQIVDKSRNSYNEPR